MVNTMVNTSFPSDSVIKKLPVIAATGNTGSIPGLGRSPGERNGYPLQYSCLENSMDRVTSTCLKFQSKDDAHKF